MPGALPSDDDEHAWCADPALDPLKSRALFLSWVLPYSHELPVLSSEVRVANATYVLSDGEDTLNVTSLAPATQYGAEVRVRNAVGLSDWSLTARLSLACAEAAGGIDEGIVGAARLLAPRCVQQ